MACGTSPSRGMSPWGEQEAGKHRENTYSSQTTALHCTSRSVSSLYGIQSCPNHTGTLAALGSLLSILHEVLLIKLLASPLGQINPHTLVDAKIQSAC